MKASSGSRKIYRLSLKATRSRSDWFSAIGDVKYGVRHPPAAAILARPHHPPQELSISQRSSVELFHPAIIVVSKLVDLHSILGEMNNVGQVRHHIDSASIAKYKRAVRTRP